MNEDNKGGAGQGEPKKKGVDTSRVLDEISRGTSARQERRTGGRQRVWPLFLLLVLLLPVLGWLAFQQWMMMDSMAALQQENRQLSAAVERSGERMSAVLDEAEAQLAETGLRLEQVQGQLDTVDERIDEQIARQLTDLDELSTDDQRVQRLQQQLDSDIDEVNARIANLQDQLAASRNQDARWLYAEVHYLLRLAERKLQLESDRDSALMLMDEAEALLQEVDGALAGTLRRNLAIDMEALSAVQPPDLAGFSDRLHGLSDAVDELTVVESYREAYDQNLASTWQEAGPGRLDERSVSGQALDLLGDIFVWRERREMPGELLPPRQEEALRQNLHLMLEQARLALLMRDDTLLQSNLQQSRDWVTHYFAVDTERVRMILDELDALMAESLETTFPDISESVSLSRQLATGVRQ